MIETREQAWQQLYQVLDIKLNQPRAAWPENLDEHEAAANRFLEENPAAGEGKAEPVQITLSSRSMGQIGEMVEGIVAPVQGALDKMSGAVELLHRIADSQELWLAILDFDTILKSDGREVKLTKPEQGYLRTLIGDILTYAGREDYLTEHLGPGPVIPPMPKPPTNRPPEGYALSEETGQPVVEQQVLTTPVPQQPPGVTIAVAPQQPQVAAQPPVESMSPLAQQRARRNAMLADMPEERDAVPPTQQVPPQPAGNEVWEGAPVHVCREWLDADDICEQCGAVVQPIRPQVVDVPVG